MCGDAGSATPTVLVDNARTRVTEWHFAAKGDNTGWHRHEYDYLVVPMADGALDITDAQGATRAALTRGVPYWRQAGVEHDVANGTEGPFSFIEVEFLESPAQETGKE